jgi:tryptophan 2,3-dioxygenase
MDELTSNQLKQIEDKFNSIDQNPNVHLEGLIWAKPITYWDYILPESLLSLQIQRTSLPDEMVFILYHQINELIFKMILWEIEQLSSNNEIDAIFFTEKLRRISRYFDMLSTSFNIMGDGMDVEQYMKFRNTLTPASGFQCAQYRLIEFASTELINLIDLRYRKDIDITSTYENAFEHLYWQAAGVDYKTGKKNTLLTLFEEKYKSMFLVKMEKYNSSNLWTRFKQLPEDVKSDPTLINAMRHYDYTVNISWVMAHYNAAGKYLGESEATGGSDWRKYMHPKYQKRIFFPDLWSTYELNNWGENL